MRGTGGELVGPKKGQLKKGLWKKYIYFWKNIYILEKYIYFFFQFFPAMNRQGAGFPNFGSQGS